MMFRWMFAAPPAMRTPSDHMYALPNIPIAGAFDSPGASSDTSDRASRFSSEKYDAPSVTISPRSRVHAVSTFGSVLSSIPNYIIALVLVVILGTQLRLLPIAQMRGATSPDVPAGFSIAFVVDILFHAALPVSVYFLATVGHWILSMKSATLATLEEDFVNAARARGLSDGRITTAYVGRNAVLPLVSQLAIQAGYVVGGAFFIESILVYPGIGLRLFKSIDQRDYTVMQGIVLLLTVSVVVANIVADLLYAKLDPRIGRAGGATG